MQLACALSVPKCTAHAAAAPQNGFCRAVRGVPLVARPASRSAQVAQAVVAAAAVAEETPRAVAHLKYQRGSPTKYRRVLDQIRGRSYEEAIMILEYMPYKACEPILKVLLSAGANAKNNLGLKKAKLVVSECYADEGPIMKRAQPRAQGRPFPIHKPTVHVTIRLQESA